MVLEAVWLGVCVTIEHVGPWGEENLACQRVLGVFASRDAGKAVVPDGDDDWINEADESRVRRGSDYYTVTRTEIR